MKFINRKNELSRLNSLMDRDESGMAVVLGRRRLGKTRHSSRMGTSSQTYLLHGR